MAESAGREGGNGVMLDGGVANSGPAPSPAPSSVQARPRSARGAGSGDDERFQFRHSDTASDSTRSAQSQEPENSDDNLSQSSYAPYDSAPPSTSSKKQRETRKKRRKARQEWEIIEGLRDGQRCADKPDRFQGFLLKKRKWPMKGWHKRFFVLDRGILTYAKSPQDIQKGKYHGVIDTGLAVLTHKRDGYRLDIDAEDVVHHIKVKGQALFEEWVGKFRHHRLYRQHEIAYGTKESPRLTEMSSPSQEIPPLSSANLPEKTLSMNLKSDGMRKSSFKTSSQGRVAAWVLDTAGFEQCTKSLNESQNTLCEMSEILEQLKNLPLTCETPAFEFSDFDHVEKRKTRFGGRGSKRKDKKNGSPTQKDIGGGGLHVPQSDSIRASASNPNLLHYSAHYSAQLPEPSSLASSHEARIQDIKLRENFMSKAETVHRQLKALLHTMNTERERLKQSLETDPGASATIATLRNSLCEAQIQNVELRSRLSKIHADSSIPDSALVSPLPSPPLEKSKAPLVTSLSAESFSLSEYYDAEENVISETSSECSQHAASDEDESEVSEEGTETDYNAVISVSDTSVNMTQTLSTGRRSKLPCPRPDTGDISLWSLLYKNIGKDLTKISMPVTLNEPLSALQRLCEELEYSELLDKAVEYDDPYERMVWVAAFAVSCYASAYYRAGHKPFNPLLGETYECIRMDKGWKFVAEQVSHHPPISACHAESKNFVFSQDMQMKTKFWGKSMEIQPVGMVNLYLPRFGEHYKWNKVTTCVHNLLGGQRWVDHYGEMTIHNGDIVCKLTFKKSHSWSAKRHEVTGHILSPEGKLVHHLFGLWNEAFFCGHAATARCIWRPGAMPEDYELYYGFTRFAIELNEFDPDQTRFLPPTDSRFRPDQRLLEEGRIQEAESEKHRVEHLQRDRRKWREEQRIDHEAKWFEKMVQEGRETFTFTGKYWELRRDPGFGCLTFQKMW